MSEDAAIRQVLESGRTITPAEAYAICGCLATHSAMARLRKQGLDIRCTMRYGNGRKWGEYAIAEPVPFGGWL